MAIGWQHYEHVVTERHEHGVLQGPVAAADGAASEIVKQHAVYGKRIVRWVAAALAGSAGDLPEVPSANAFAAAAVLLTREVNQHSPIPYDKGQYLYCLWGEYTYGLVAPRPIDGDFPTGGLPPSMGGLGDATAIFPAAKFRRYLDTGNLTPTR